MLEILNVKNFCGTNGLRVGSLVARLDRIVTRMKLYNKFTVTATSNVTATSDQTAFGSCILRLTRHICGF